MKFDLTLRERPCVSLVVLLCCLDLVRAEYAVAENQVSYVGSPPPPIEGALLPQPATTQDTIFARESLPLTFQNPCFAAALNGNASITIDPSQMTVLVDFDESTATASPICFGVYLPVSTMQLELDPLPAGTWTLEIDEMLTILLPIPSQTIVFEVVAPGASVPAGGSFYYVALLVGAILTATLRARAKSHARCGTVNQPIH